LATKITVEFVIVILVNHLQEHTNFLKLAVWKTKKVYKNPKIWQQIASAWPSWLHFVL